MVLLVSPAHAQQSGLSFLRIGAGAASAGMADAYVAHGRDAFAAHWNPSGLAVSGGNTVAVSHYLWIADVRSYAVSSRFQAGKNGGIGLFVLGAGSGDLEARDRPGDPDGLFSAQFLSFGAAYGRRFGPLRLGLTAKFLSERIYTEDAAGFAVDVGLQADALRGGLRVGAALQNVGRMSELNLEATPLPRTLRAGAAVYPFRIVAEQDQTRLLNTFITAEAAYLFPAGGDGLVTDYENELRIHTGLAAEVMEMVTLRAGLVTNDAVRRFTFGAGIEYGSFGVDYAFLPLQEGFGGPGHFLTLAYHW